MLTCVVWSLTEVTEAKKVAKVDNVYLGRIQTLYVVKLRDA